MHVWLCSPSPGCCPGEGTAQLCRAPAALQGWMPHQAQPTVTGTGLSCPPWVPPTQLLHAWRSLLRGTPGSLLGLRCLQARGTDPWAGAPALGCSHPGSGAAESLLPLSFPLKWDLPLSLPGSGISWGGKALAATRAGQPRPDRRAQEHYPKSYSPCLCQPSMAGPRWGDAIKPPPNPCAGESQAQRCCRTVPVSPGQANTGSLLRPPG